MVVVVLLLVVVVVVVVPLLLIPKDRPLLVRCLDYLRGELTDLVTLGYHADYYWKILVLDHIYAQPPHTPLSIRFFQ